MLLCSHTKLKVFHSVKNIFLFRFIAVSLQRQSDRTAGESHIAVRGRLMGEEKASTYFCKFWQYIRSKVTAEKLQKYIGRAHYPEDLHLLVSVQCFDPSLSKGENSWGKKE